MEPRLLPEEAMRLGLGLDLPILSL
jgi:hypothetical protein